MQTYEALKHTTWECKYHVVFKTKCRRKALYVELRRDLGAVFRDLAGQKECTVEEGHLMTDHVHMLVSVPPKYAVAAVMYLPLYLAKPISRHRDHQHRLHFRTGGGATHSGRHHHGVSRRTRTRAKINLSGAI